MGWRGSCLLHWIYQLEQRRLALSRVDGEAHYTNQYFPIPVWVDDFSTSERKKIILEIANGGQGVVKWCIDESCSWLTYSATNGETRLQERLTLTVNRELLPEGEQEFCFHIRAGEESVPVQVKAKQRDFSMVPSGCFLPQKGRYVIPAVDYIEKQDGNWEGQKASYERLDDYGKYETGMKVFPVTASFTKGTDRRSPGSYLCSVGRGDNVCAAWEHAMLIQEHVSTKKITLKKGENRITLYPREAEPVLERLVIYPTGKSIEASYLGPDTGFKKE